MDHTEDMCPLNSINNPILLSTVLKQLNQSDTITITTAISGKSEGCF